MIPDGLTIFALNSRQRSPVRSSSLLRSSDVALPPGRKSWTPKTSRRYSSKQLLLDGVFPSLPHRRPSTVERLSSASSPLSELPSFERPTSSIWRRKSCAAVGLVGHPRTDEVLSKKLAKMRSVQGSRCWASVRRLYSSAQKRLCRLRRVTVETVGRMTSYIHDVIIEPNDIIMQNEPIDKLRYGNFKHTIST